MHAWHACKDDRTLQAPPASYAIYHGLEYSVRLRNPIPDTSVPILRLFCHRVLAASLGPRATRQSRLQTRPLRNQVVQGLMIQALYKRNRQNKLFLSRLKRTRNQMKSTGDVEAAFARAQCCHFLWHFVEVFRHCLVGGGVAGCTVYKITRKVVGNPRSRYWKNSVIVVL
jgi:hypothetical protein